MFCLVLLVPLEFSLAAEIVLHRLALSLQCHRGLLVSAVVLLSVVGHPLRPTFPEDAHFTATPLSVIKLPAAATKRRPTTLAHHMSQHTGLTQDHILAIWVWANYPVRKLPHCLLQLHVAKLLQLLAARGPANILCYETVIAARSRANGEVDRFAKPSHARTAKNVAASEREDIAIADLIQADQAIGPRLQLFLQRGAILHARLLAGCSIKIGATCCARERATSCRRQRNACNLLRKGARGELAGKRRRGIVCRFR
jgi:hypothetical protein